SRQAQVFPAARAERGLHFQESAGRLRRPADRHGRAQGRAGGGRRGFAGARQLHRQPRRRPRGRRHRAGPPRARPCAGRARRAARTRSVALRPRLARRALNTTMPTTPVITVFCGGVSPEREVSLGSGQASAQALARVWPTRLVRIDEAALPAGLDPARDVVFSTLHGTFGEDGGMQRLLDAAGIHYAGCGADSSALTMDKHATKAACATADVRVAAGLVFAADAKPDAAAVVAALGERVVIKPNDQGSSVGLVLADGRAEIAAGLAGITAGDWLAEPWLRGRELSVGVLGGRALGVVEIRPKSGVYDFTSKYTKGMTEYFAPAPLDAAATERVRLAAERAFAACG